MAIENDEQLHEAVARAGSLLQEIQTYLGKHGYARKERADAKVRFPRGYIRTAAEQRARLPFIEDKVLKDNLAYTLILSDTVLWIYLRTDVWGTPKEMLIKAYAFLIASLVESITKAYLEGICGKNFKKRNEFLVEKGIISTELRDDLDWLWDTRNKMHLFQLDKAEYANDYNFECHMRCVKTFRALIKALNETGHIGGA